MNSFHSLRLKAKIIGAFLAVSLLIICLGAFSVSSVYKINNLLVHQNQIDETELLPLYAAREALDQTGLAARNAFIFPEEAAAQRELGLLDVQRTAYLEQLTRLEKVFGSDPQFLKVKDGLLKMAHELDRPRKYRQAHDMTTYGNFLVNECSPLRRQIVEDINVLLTSTQQRMMEASTLAAAGTQQGALVIGLASILILALCMSTGWLLVASLQRQIGGDPADALEVAGEIGQGNLEAGGTLVNESNKPVHRKPSLIGGILKMRDSLAGIVTRIREGNVQMNEAIRDIAAGNNDLSRRTELQASSLQQTAASMEQLSGTVQNNAEAAQHVSQIALDATASARTGALSVEAMVLTMEEISGASKKIADIIGVIDGIAFQTNILSLNAAVEAARAGESGRGFAVVAAEVRNLAGRSADAAREIRSLIQESVQTVGKGTLHASAANSAMLGIVGQFEQVEKLIGEISHATQEQSSGIQQIATAISALEETTQQNAALVEQSTAATASLMEQSDAMRSLVSVFRVSGQQVSGMTGAALSAILPRSPARHISGTASPAIHYGIAA